MPGTLSSLQRKGSRVPFLRPPGPWVPTVSGGPQLGSVARPTTGNATSASVRPAAPLLPCPALCRGPWLRPHRSLPRYWGRPPARSSCPGDSLPLSALPDLGALPAKGRLAAPVEDQRPVGAFRWLGREAGWEAKRSRTRGREAGGDKPSPAGKQETTPTKALTPACLFWNVHLASLAFLPTIPFSLCTSLLLSFPSHFSASAPSLWSLGWGHQHQLTQAWSQANEIPWITLVLVLPLSYCVPWSTPAISWSPSLSVLFTFLCIYLWVWGHNW